MGLDALERVRGRWGAEVVRRRLFVFRYRRGVVVRVDPIFDRTVGCRCWGAGGPGVPIIAGTVARVPGLLCMKILTAVLSRLGGPYVSLFAGLSRLRE